MGHHISVEAEQYIFKPETKRKLFILIGAGILVFVLGIIMAMNSGHDEHAGGHASTEITKALVASTEGSGEAQHPAAHEAAAGEHHGSATWVKRIYTSLWMNNIYFVGLGIIGLFFVCIQYAAQAGWSSGMQRIPLAMGRWIPIAGILTLVLWFVVKNDIFHWVHHNLYEGPETDKILLKKAPYFFWPLHAGSFPLFYVVRMVLFFSMWYMFFLAIKKRMMAEDLDGDTQHWFKSRSIAAWFLVFFAVSSSVSAWDWVMSIDAHWFSTMFGWYVFASWWVTGLAFIAFTVASLKKAGYLKIVNSNHLHDLGKFCFAFSIFWTYIWFSQFMLIYYANIPEETVYFIERMRTSPYSWIFFANLILNFVLPFLLFMTRDAKRQVSMLLVVTPIIMIGHWLDFFNMITPGVMKYEGGLGFLEIGLFMIFLGSFLYVVLNGLTKLPLIGKNHPMLQESLHHHI